MGPRAAIHGVRLQTSALAPCRRSPTEHSLGCDPRSPVTSFCTGSSAPSARRRAAGGAGAPSSRTERLGHRAVDPTEDDVHASARHQGQVAARWPPAPLDPGHCRANGAGYRVDGSLLADPTTHPPRTPQRFSAAPSAPDARRSSSSGEAGNAFAMRRSGVRIPSAPPLDPPVSR